MEARYEFLHTVASFGAALTGPEPAVEKAREIWRNNELAILRACTWDQLLVAFGNNEDFENVRAWCLGAVKPIFDLEGGKLPGANLSYVVLILIDDI